MALKFCANLNFLFTENSAGFLERYRAARRAGFRAVESGFPAGVKIEDIVQVKRETGLEHVLLNISTDGPDGMQFGCAALPSGEEQFKLNLEETVTVAKTLNCKKIHVMAGKCSSEPTEENFKTYINNLTYATRVFEKENLIGVIEPINKYALPGYFLNNYEKALTVLNTVNSPCLKLMVDIYHLQHIKGNLTYTLKDLSSYIGHIQVAQVPSRHEPGEPGEIDFAYVFKAISEVGYQDWIGCEYKPKTNTVDGLDWVQKFGFTL